ncbi:MAG: adenosylmethionine--8-amino-7-oxononanoate transaminase [Verrucomicrobiota bacterium]
MNPSSQQPELKDRDRAHGWHPFTQMAAWDDPAFSPVVIERGEGVWLWDTEGRRYLDGNSSIWTNLHGHGHPAIVEAIARQARQLDHSSFLGYTHPRAIELAERLCGFFPAGTLERCFFSDNGSTAIEVALKLAIQYRQQNGEPERTGFASFANAYHGDTLGAASLGGVTTFFERFAAFGLQPERVRDLADLQRLDASQLTAVIIEPLIQGVNRMTPWPSGMLRELRAWCTQHDVFLILDEVMTGFGRTGTLFACQQEDILPDFLCLAKGLTGGTLPLAATLTTPRLYQGFLGGPDRTFYYGHSYCANPLGCAAALASLDLFEKEQTLEHLPAKIERLRQGRLALEARHPEVLATRQCGFMAGIDLALDGASFCRRLLGHGLLTRPIGDTVVLLPPLAIDLEELDFAFAALSSALTSPPPTAEVKALPDH